MILFLCPMRYQSFYLCGLGAWFIVGFVEICISQAFATHFSIKILYCRYLQSKLQSVSVYLCTRFNILNNGCRKCTSDYDYAP